MSSCPAKYSSKAKKNPRSRSDVLRVPRYKERKNRFEVGLDGGGLALWQRSGCVAALTAPGYLS